MKKSELKEMIKSAFMAENQAEDTESADQILARIMGTEVDPYMAEEVVAEAEEEEDVKVKVDVEDLEDEVDVDAEDTDLSADDEEVEDKNDSIVIDKKIVSLSSLPGETRKILDTLETLRAQAEEFGDQKFITQVGNTITFFTRDFVVAGDAPNPNGIEEADKNYSDNTKEEAELTLESLRMQKIAGIITEGVFKTKANEITKAVNNPNQIDSPSELIGKAEKFSDQPEVERLLGKMKAALGDKGIEAIKKSVSSVNELDIDTPEFDDFVKQNIRNWAPKLKGKTNEDVAEMADELAYKIADFVRGFAKVNILSMGMLPALTAAAVEYFGGPEVLSKSAELVGDGAAAGGISVIATILGSMLVWKLVDKATGEETDLA